MERAAFSSIVCHQSVTHGYIVESSSGTGTWWAQNHNRQPAVVQGPSPWSGEEQQEHLCAAEGSEVQGWPAGRQFIQTDDGPERVESSIQSRNIQENKGNVTDR